VPRLYSTRIYSLKLIYTHFWLATVGIVLYITSMWIAGIGQGLFLRAFDDYGNLKYSFIETVSFLHQPYVWRAIGGIFFVSGLIVMIYNIIRTIFQAKREAAELEAKLATKLANA
jgi:cytochrome c oxidase cbb3-type subunit 1